MKNLARYLYEYFYFTRRERDATFVLIFLCLAFFLAPAVYSYFMPPKSEYDFSEFQAAIAAVTEKEKLETIDLDDAPNFRNAAPKPIPVELFKFDPNSISKYELIRLGILPRTAQTLINFRSKGGSFFKKEDLKKIYGLREEDYARLQDWIVIEKTKALPLREERQRKPPEKENVSTFTQKEVKAIYPKETIEPIDINQATQEQWQQLYGIGPAYSKRIVNFREKLGGFSSIEQIGKTYGLPDSTFQKILPYLTPSPVFRKIKINSCAIGELKDHPFISNYQATILFNYRKQHGTFLNMDNLKNIKAGFEEGDWSVLKAYFSFE